MDSAGDNNLITTQLLMLLLLRRRKAENKRKCERKTRRWWVRPVNVKRDKRGEFRRFIMELKMHDKEWFFAYTRMTPPLFDNLLNLVGPHLKKNSIRTPISASQRLLITLRFLATGDSYFSIAQSYQVGKSTVCAIIKEVTVVIWNILKAIVMAEPTEEQLLNIAHDYWNIWNMPHCVGSIDGKHIRITAPAKSGSLYYNYKGYFSIVLLGICDAYYNFTYIDVGAYGSVSDGGVFSTSAFGKKLQEDMLSVPRHALLPNSNVDMNYFFVGDAAFPLSTKLMRPYSGTRLNVVKSVFNYRLARARRVIENTFGILVARWRIFHREICASPENVDNIVKATVLLHNFIKASSAKEHYCPANFVDGENVLGKWRQEVEKTIMETCNRLGSNNSSNIAFNMRNTLAKYFLSPPGFKEGQIEYVKRS